GVIGAAVRESILEPGIEPPPRRRWGARGAMVSAALLLVLLLWGGKRWLDAEAADYRDNRLDHALTPTTRVFAEDGQRVLRVEINDPKFARSPPLVPDHGKLMQQILVREPSLVPSGLLHPMK